MIILIFENNYKHIFVFIFVSFILQTHLQADNDFLKDELEKVEEENQDLREKVKGVLSFLHFPRENIFKSPKV